MTQASEKTRIGVVGVGRMGENHLKKYLQHPEVELVGFYDANSERSAEISEKYGVKSFASLDLFLFEVDAVSVVTATSQLFSVSKKALESGVHVLVEKPLTESADEALELAELARRNQLQLHVGFLERFRLKQMLAQVGPVSPNQIQLFRLNTSVGREPDRDVITDLMIHDIDLAHSLSGGHLVSHQVAASTVTTANWDEAQANLVFSSGVVASIITSRVAGKLARGLRLVGSGTSLEFDFVLNSVRGVYRGVSGAQHRIDLTLDSLDPLQLEVGAFVSAVKGQTVDHVSAEEASATIKTANLLLQTLKKPMPGARADVVRM